MKNGFTLAEVLITLGIIGVVAAMTMPSLIANYQKKVWTNQLKKSISTLEQGFKKMLADEEVENLTDTSCWAEFNGRATYNFCTTDDYGSDSECTAGINCWKNYFNIISIGKPDKTYEIKDLIGGMNNNTSYTGDYSENIFLKFSDGMWVYSDGIFGAEDADTSSFGSQTVAVLVDVNGSKRPNQLGRDIFYIPIENSGKFRYSSTCNATGAGSGSNCAGRIIANGWRMDY